MKLGLLGTTWEYLEREVMDDYAPMLLSAENVSEVHGFRLVHDDAVRFDHGSSYTADSPRASYSGHRGPRYRGGRLGFRLARDGEGT